MRLLNVNTRQLEEFFDNAIPPYAILSHTWGKEEVTLQDLSREGHQQKQGYTKIEGCCQQAIKNDLSWIWVDTCCIDKTSSAELSEAINSMYRWYENSEMCYAYLQDVPSGIDVYEQDSAFRRSRWFTRGWTLQELLAPLRIQFYDTNWTYIFLLDYSKICLLRRSFFSEEELIVLLSDITSIDTATFLRYKFSKDHRSPSAACVFSWMARRSTTRVEDKAYCMLGLLKINMPLLYGEGEKAFIRLQEAILSTSDDISLLTWGYHTSNVRGQSYLASSPEEFLSYPKGNAYPSRRITRMHTTVTGRGLHIELPMILIDTRSRIWLAIVEEEMSGRPGIAIILESILGGNAFRRVSSCPPVPIRLMNLPLRTTWAIESKQIYIAAGNDYVLYGWRPPISTIWRRFLFPVRPVRDIWYTLLVPSLGCEKMEITISETGYSFSSSWPPLMGDGLYSTEPRVFYRFDLHRTVFYIIFSNEKQERFAVRVEIKWGKYGAKVVKPTFCVLTNQHIHTALEHCCGTRFGSKEPQFAKEMDWRSYFTAKNVTTNEIGHIYATKTPSYIMGRPDCCNIMWKKGLYSEEESATVLERGETLNSTEQ